MITEVSSPSSNPCHQYNKTYYEMTVIDKQSLISESVTVMQVDIHPVGDEPDQHVIHVTPGVSHTTTVCEVPTKLKSGLCSRDEVLAPSDHLAQPSSWDA
jgi:hypothetical protein